MFDLAAPDAKHCRPGPEALQHQIDRQQSLGDLRSLSGPIGDLAGNLGEARIDGARHARLVSRINDRFVGRALELIQGRLGSPPVPWCWLALGAAGREEEVSLARLEVAVVYADGDASGATLGAGAWFASLVQALGEFLASCCGTAHTAPPAAPLLQWKHRLETALARGVPDEVRAVVPLLDLRPVHGDLRLAQEVRAHVAGLPGSRAALPAVLAELRERRHPLFSRSIPRLPSRRGAQQPRFDLGRHGLSPIVNQARAWAFALGCAETSTLARLRALGASRRELGPAAADLAAAYDYLLGLAIRSRGAQSSGNVEVDLLDARSLGPIDTQLSSWALGLAVKAPDMIPLPGRHGAAARLWSLLSGIARFGRRPSPRHDRFPAPALEQAERRPPEMQS